MCVNKFNLKKLIYFVFTIFFLNAILPDVVTFRSFSCTAVPSNRVLRTIGTVRVYNPGPDYPWGTWPEGIKVVNEFENSESVLGDGHSKSKYNYSKNNKSNTRRTFSWKGEELQVYFEITPPTSRVSTQLAPPLTWLTNGLATRSKVKVLHNSEVEIDGSSSSSSSSRDSSSVSAISSVASAISSSSSSQSISSSAVKLGIERESVEDSLSVLRMNGFKKEDIFRMFDKGPWVIAFELSKILPRLIGDLQSHVGVTQTEAIHIISHCPYLLAQYARYKGRDVQRTIEALVEVGYSTTNLVNDCMRFPSMLAAPPDRLKGWKSLLENFGIADDPKLFGSLLKRAPYMFYLDPPFVHDMFGADFSRTSGGVTTSASSSFLFEALEVLQYLDTLNLYDMDKLIRAEPQILVESTVVLQGRVEFMMALFMELWDSEQSRNDKSDTSSTSTTTLTIDQGGLEQEVDLTQGQGQGQAFVTAPLGTAWEGAESSDKSSVQYEYPQQQVDTAKDWLRALLQSYPAVISLDVTSIRSVCNALRSCGLRRSDVVQLIRKYPPVLRLDPDYLKLLVNFLRGRLKLPKHEIRSFLVRNSHFMKTDMKDLIRLVNYYEDLGGDLPSIRDCPMYFRRSLDDFIIPRAEFLKALQFDPLFRGIDFLVSASADEIADMAGVSTTIWNKFYEAWIERRTTTETEEIGSTGRVDTESENFSLRND